MVEELLLGRTGGGGPLPALGPDEGGGGEEVEDIREGLMECRSWLLREDLRTGGGGGGGLTTPPPGRGGGGGGGGGAPVRWVVGERIGGGGGGGGGADMTDTIFVLFSRTSWRKKEVKNINIIFNMYMCVCVCVYIHKYTCTPVGRVLFSSNSLFDKSEDVSLSTCICMYLHSFQYTCMCFKGTRLTKNSRQLGMNYTQ